MSAHLTSDLSSKLMIFVPALCRYSQGAEVDDEELLFKLNILFSFFLCAPWTQKEGGSTTAAVTSLPTQWV